VSGRRASIKHKFNKLLNSFLAPHTVLFHRHRALCKTAVPGRGPNFFGFKIVVELHF